MYTWAVYGQNVCVDVRKCLLIRVVGCRVDKETPQKFELNAFTTWAVSMYVWICGCVYWFEAWDATLIRKHGNKKNERPVRGQYVHVRMYVPCAFVDMQMCTLIWHMGCRVDKETRKKSRQDVRACTCAYICAHTYVWMCEWVKWCKMWDAALMRKHESRKRYGWFNSAEFERRATYI